MNSPISMQEGDCLQFLIKKLEESVNGANQAAVTLEIEEFLKIDKALWYLNRVAFAESGLNELVRALAALLLKNKIAKCTEPILLESFVRDCGAGWFAVFPAVKSSSEVLQKSLGSVIATAGAKCEAARMEVLKQLVGDFAVFYSVLLHLCEDRAVGFTAAETELVISSVLNSAQLNKARKALILSQFTPVQIFSIYPPETLIPYFDKDASVTADSNEDLCIAELLLQLTQYNDRCQVAAFTCWLKYYYQYPELSHSLLEALSNYVDVEFRFFEEGYLRQHPDHFSSFLSCLLDRCVFVDEAELCRALEDLNVPDADETGRYRFMRQEDSDSDDSEEGQLDEADDPESLDSIRNCSLTLLQVLTLCCPRAELALLLLPLLFSRAESADWAVRESALMAFSMLTELRQTKTFSGHLPNLLQFALANAQSNNVVHPLIRSASLCCLGNYAEWLIKFHQHFPEKSILKDVKSAVINCLRDSNKRVQESACRAISHLLKADCDFDPDCLLPALMSGLACFQLRNRRLVYTVISDVVVSSRGGFDCSPHWQPIAALLNERFDNQSIQDGSVFPLIGALASIQPQVGFSQPLFMKASALAINSLHAVDFSESFLTAALDLLDAVIEAHPEACHQPQQQQLLASILDETFAKAEETDTLQSAFALFGDSRLANVPESYWRALEANLMPSSIFPASTCGDRIISVGAASNAVWSFGLLCCLPAAAALPDTGKVSLVQKRLIAVLEGKLRTPLGSGIYFENIAVALGRSARICPLLSHNISPTTRSRIVQILSRVEDESERESAIKYL